MILKKKKKSNASLNDILILKHNMHVGLLACQYSGFMVVFMVLHVSAPI